VVGATNGVFRNFMIFAGWSNSSQLHGVDLLPGVWHLILSFHLHQLLICYYMQYRLLSPYHFIRPPNMCNQGKVVIERACNTHRQQSAKHRNEMCW